MKIHTPLMVAALAALGTGLAFAAPGERLKLIDSNGDGKVQVTEIEAQAAKNAAEIDANGDGRITATELEVWHEAKRAARAEQRLLRLDSDKDGVVTVDEFAAARAGKAAKRDVNGDGVISADEMRGKRHRMHRHGPRDADG